MAGRDILNTEVQDKESVSPRNYEDEREAKEEEGEEGTKPKYRRLEPEPTQEEVEEHNIDHAVFRNWCPHCVKGRAVAFPHTKVIGKEKEDISTISIDYMFMTEKQDKEEEKGNPIIVMKDRSTKMTWAHVLSKKGKDPYAIKRISKNVSLLGYKRTVFKSDGEPAIVALKEAVKAEQDTELICEESPVGEHQSNGEIEATIRQVQGQIRTMKDALETRIGE